MLIFATSWLHSYVNNPMCLLKILCKFCVSRLKGNFVISFYLSSLRTDKCWKNTNVKLSLNSNLTNFKTQCVLYTRYIFFQNLAVQSNGCVLYMSVCYSQIITVFISRNVSGEKKPNICIKIIFFSSMFIWQKRQSHAWMMCFEAVTFMPGVNKGVPYEKHGYTVFSL